MSKLLLIFTLILLTSFAEARLCRDAFRMPYGGSIVSLQSRDLINHLNRFQFSSLANMIIPGPGRNQVKYKAELVEDGVLIQRTSQGDYYSSQNRTVERPIRGAITIAPHSRIPGLFVVGKFDGNVEYVSYDLPRTEMNRRQNIKELNEAMQSRSNEALILWMELRERFIPDDRAFELLGMIDTYQSTRSLYAQRQNDSVGEFRPIRDLNLESFSQNVNSESILSVFVGLSGRIFVNRRGHLYPKVISE